MTHKRLQTRSLSMALWIYAAVMGCAHSQEVSSVEKQNGPEPSPTAVVTQEGFTPVAESRPSETDLPTQAPGDLSLRLTQMEATIQALQQKIENYERARKTEALAKPIRKHPADELPDVPGEVKLPPAGHTDRDPAIEKFRSARILLESGKHSEAVLAFTDFVNSYGDHPLAGSAQYLTGEAYYLQKEYRLSESEWKRVLTIYPRSSSVPETLARLVEVQEKIGNPNEAAQNRQRLLSLFPNSPAAKGFMNKTEMNLATEVPPEEPRRVLSPSPAPLPEGIDRAEGVLPSAGSDLPAEAALPEME